MQEITGISFMCTLYRIGIIHTIKPQPGLHLCKAIQQETEPDLPLAIARACAVQTLSVSGARFGLN